MSAEHIHPTAKMSVSALGDLLMYIGVRAPSAETVQWLEREVLGAADAAGRRGVYMHVVLPSPDATRGATSQTRAAMQHFVKACGPKFLAAAVVFSHAGFLGATVRSVFSAVLFAARPVIPVKMFATPEDATAWLSSVSACQLPTGAAVAEHVARLRAELHID